jgi:hypothetical protein
MKRILSVSAVFLFFASMFFASCTTGRLCPAYPPSVLQGESLQKIDGRNANIQLLEVQDNSL